MEILPHYSEMIIKKKKKKKKKKKMDKLHNNHSRNILFRHEKYKAHINGPPFFSHENLLHVCTFFRGAIGSLLVQSAHILDTGGQAVGVAGLC